MFYIDNENTITWAPIEAGGQVRVDTPEVKGTYDVKEVSGDGFASIAELADIATTRKWSKGDVTAIWNGFAGTPGFSGLKPQKAFKNRPFGLKAIWDAIQRLIPKESEEPVKKKPAAKKKTAKKATPKPSGRTAEKRDLVIRLMSRKSGATVADIMNETGWLAHSTRGFVSTLRSKHGVAVTTEKHATRGTIYRVAA